MPISFGATRGFILPKGQPNDPLTLEIDTSLSAGLTYNLFVSSPCNINIDWGDGTTGTYSNAGTFSDISVNKTYAASGIYQIKVTGSATAIGYGGTSANSNINKLKRVLSWGNIANLTRLSIGNQSSLTEVPTTLPSTVTSLLYMFYGCSTFNQDISGWDTKNVTNMSGMFQSATTFNKNIGAWNTAKVTNMASMFSSATAFNQPVGAWNTSSATNMSSMFYNASAFNQNLGAWNVSKVTNFSQMFRGNGVSVAFNNGGSPDINNWALNTSVGATVDLSQMFRGNTVFNQPIGGWNTSKVTTIDSMFDGALAFNNGGLDNIKNWDTSNITNFFSTFRQAKAFNQPIGSWNTANVTNMSRMFDNATAGNNAFNQDIGAWNVSKVTNFSQMFLGSTTTNQVFNNGGSDSIKNWTINTTAGASVNMNSMFSYAGLFNQPIGLWNTANVTDMGAMFARAVAFNQNIGAWNVSKVTSFSSMFLNATAFNNGGSPDINNWVLNTTVGANLTMASMFQNATAFNQPLGNWDTSAVYIYNQMFNTASSFNQNIGTWKLGAKVAASGELTGQVTQPGFLNNVGMSVENYSRTLIGWANYIHNLNDDFTAKGPLVGATAKQVNSVEYGGTPYSNGVAARAFLLSRQSTLYQNWYGVAMSNNGSTMFASAATSYIFKSSDGGDTWKARVTDAQRTWQDIACSSDGTKVAAAHSGGNIWTSTDGGETWTQRTGSGNRNWQCITMSADGSLIAATVNGNYIYTSTDDGVTWTARMTDATRVWHGIAANSDGTKLVATVYNGQIYTSTDSGATWTTRNSARAWRECCISADGTKLAAVVEGGGASSIPNGYIYTSTDSGATWTARITDQLRAWNGISCSSNGSTLAAICPVAHPGTGGYIYTSTDSGVTWTQRTPGVPGGARQWAGAVAVSGDGVKMLAGSYSTSGEIYLSAARLHRSVNSGATWSRLTYPNSKSSHWSLSDAGIADSTAFYVDMASYSTDTPSTLFAYAGANGTLINSPSYSTSFGGHLSFDGTNQYILGNTNLGISGNATFTMGGWVYMNSIPTDWPSFMGNNSTGTGLAGLSITMNSGRPALDFWNTKWRAAAALSSGAWYHIMVTKSAGAISTTSKIYVNGVEVAGALEGTDGTPNITNAPWVLGRLQNVAGRYFNGKIASAIAYTRVLTAQEILDLYNAQKNRFGL